MFCSQCGTKLSEEAVFCPNCGTKVDMWTPAADSEAAIPLTGADTPEISVTPPETHQQASANHEILYDGELQEAYDELSRNASSCPPIKEIIFKPEGLMLRGRVNMYNYKCSPSQMLLWNLKLRYQLLIIPCIACDQLFFITFSDKEYNPVLSLCTLVGCVIWFLLVMIVDKEAREVTGYVEKTLDCKFPVSYGWKVWRTVQYLFNSVEAVLCLLALMSGGGIYLLY